MKVVILTQQSDRSRCYMQFLYYSSLTHPPTLRQIYHQIRESVLQPPYETILITEATPLVMGFFFLGDRSTFALVMSKASLSC